MSAHTLRHILLTSTLLAGAALAVSARAEPADVTDVASVIITGSRIAHPNLDQPTPVSTLSSEQIERAGTANLGDIIALLPEIGSGYSLRANSNNFGNGAGLSQIDLHNLGPSRTLVLVNGQRHVAGDISTNAVDLNAIPAALVDRVEVITGGASALYGSDAVSGVVNIILKKKFEGVDAQAQVGGYDGYGENSSASFTVGKNIWGDRGNVTLSGFWTEQAAIYARDVANSRNYGEITNYNDLNGALDPTFLSSPSPKRNDGIPDHLLVPNVGSEYLPRNGVLQDPNTGNLFSFDKSGKLIPTPVRTGYNSYAFGQLPANCGDSCYFPETYTQASTPLKTRGLDATGHYDVNPHLHGSLDIKYVETSAKNLVQPDYTFGSYTIASDNAFMSPDTLAALGGAGAGYINPSYNAFVNDNRIDNAYRRTYRIVAALEGDFDVGLAAVKWDGAVNYGQTVSHFSNTGSIVTNNFQAALDSVIDPATGKPACRVNVPSAQGADYTPPTGLIGGTCVPFNPFGQQNGPDAFAYSFLTQATRDFLSQQDVNVNFTADSSRFFNLQGGPIAIAVGGEYRMERTYERNAPTILSGITDYLGANSSGGYNVYEYYGEVSAPVFKKKGLGLDELTFDIALRNGRYSTVGDVHADKFSVVYGPINWVKLRSTASLAVRAPNITEAFSPAQPTYYNVSDPCDQNNIASNVNYAKNCAVAGVPVGFTSNLNGSITGQTSGNRSLAAEKSLSYTGGVVIQPPIVPHLSVSIDYYSILIKDAITDIDAQDVIDNCYNSAVGLQSQYCSLFTRGADGNINFVKTTYVNAAKLFNQGMEFQADYFADVAPLTRLSRYTERLTGRVNLSLDVNYVIKLRNFPFQNDVGHYNVWEAYISGTEGDVPQIRGLLDSTYKQGPLQLGWQVRYVGRAARFSRDATAADHSESRNVPFAEAKFYHNLTVRYDLGAYVRGAEVFAGVNDVFGDLPPIGLIQGGNGDAAYDLGRYIYTGVRFRR